VTYKNTSVQVELSPDTVYKTETIIVDSPPTQIIQEAEKSKQGAIIVLIAVGVLVGMFSIYCARYLFLKKTQTKLDA